MNYEIYHKNKDSWTLRMDIGQFKKVPAPKFFDGQVVTTSRNHYSRHTVVILSESVWTDNLGWRYGNRYCEFKCGEIKVGGGASFWHNEEDFQPVTDPEIKLAIEIHYRTEELVRLREREAELERQLKNLSYAQEVIGAAAKGE